MADQARESTKIPGDGTQRRLSVKDFATMDIFCTVMFVIFMAYSILTGASLFYSMIFNAAGAALILSPFYMYMSMKVGKHGPAFVYNLMWAIVAGLMMGPFMVPWFLGGGILAELSMVGKGAYHDVKRVAISWIVCCLVRAAHGMSEIWFFKDAFLATGVSDAQIQIQTQFYTDPLWVCVSLAVTVALAVLGCYLSNKLVVKHFRKTGAIK
ncbi:MptD family putative ECF transporter S component [Curtanaerobium respiraculi]|uniref:MptD family putative ECF transporter S component n=1 Tax=Curtanaerobium respiraculi TaxID=2949669 RepID=UPI0024B37A7D|nr:MptD family putative ECF transporter S component [Curtanaerobium respiraculi]